MRPTIKDIAEAAGVTHGVVSSVLNSGNQRVRASEETAERIRQVAKELGYRPSAYARSFRSSRTKAIGVLHGEGRSRLRLDDGSRYFARLMDGVIDGAFDHGYTVAFCPRLLGDAATGALADGRFDGYIWYSTMPTQESLKAIRECPYPIVLIHSPPDLIEYKVPTVICDNSSGIRLALEHLKSLGHQRISFASNHGWMYLEAKLRQDAFLKHGADMGLDVTLVDLGEGLEEMAESWLRQRPYTAFIAHNEAAAALIMESFMAAGIRIPEDVSAIGFDSTDFCLLQKPALTAIAQPLSALGRAAVERLVEILDGKPPHIETVLPCSLDVRESTGPAHPRT